jgi:hypothetical protein
MLPKQATGREAECIALYKSLEDTHPNAKVKRQAANLRFIMEAPKLKLGPDERVSVPVLASPNRFACARPSLLLITGFVPSLLEEPLPLHAAALLLALP